MAWYTVCFGNGLVTFDPVFCGAPVTGFFAYSFEYCRPNLLA